MLLVLLLFPLIAESGTKKIKLDWDEDAYQFTGKIKLKANTGYKVKAKRTDKESQPSMPTFKLYFESPEHSEDYEEFSVFPSVKSGKTVSWTFRPDTNITLLRIETKGISRGIRWQFWIE